MQKRNLPVTLFDSRPGAARQSQHPSQEGTLLLGEVLVSHGGATATLGHLCMPMTQRQVAVTGKLRALLEASNTELLLKGLVQISVHHPSLYPY